MRFLVKLLRLKTLTCDSVVAVGSDLDLDGLLPGVSPADAPHVRLHLALPLPRVLGANILQLDEALVALVVALEPEVDGKSTITSALASTSTDPEILIFVLSLKMIEYF